jgi:hypothetical protein
MAKLRGHPNILRLHAVAFAGPKGAETDGFFLLDYCVSDEQLAGPLQHPVGVGSRPAMQDMIDCNRGRGGGEGVQ